MLRRTLPTALLLAALLAPGHAVDAPTTDDSTLNAIFTVIYQRLEALEEAVASLLGTQPPAIVRCGDGLINGTDQCDGNALPVGDATCTACTSPTSATPCACVRPPVCGDSLIQAPEVCDPPGIQGIPAGCTGTDRCSDTCRACDVQTTSAVCGDAVVTSPEVCDGPWDVSTCSATQVCNQSCTACRDCGNGTLDSGEACDPGTDFSVNNPSVYEASDAACPTLCRGNCTCPAPVCGNGIVELGECCDPAATNVGTNTGALCAYDHCTGQCKCDCGPPPNGTGTCGNGMLDRCCAGLLGSTSPSGQDEDCETGGTTGGTTTALGSMLDVALDAARVDPVYVDTGLDATYDFVDHELALIGVTTPRSPYSGTGTEEYLVHKGGQSSTTSGYRAIFLNNGSARMQYRPVDDAGTPFTALVSCSTATGVIKQNVPIAYVWTRTKLAGVETVKFYRKQLGVDTAFSVFSATCDHTTAVAAACTGAGAPVACCTGAGTASGCTGFNWSNSSTNFTLYGRNSSTGCPGTCSNDKPLNSTSDEFYVLSCNAGEGCVNNYVTTRMETEAGTHVDCTAKSDMTGCWHFNDTDVNALDNEKSATNADANGAVSLVPSTYSANSGGGTVGAVACSAGQICQDGICQCAAVGGGPLTIYWSPGGGDANDGRTETTPVRTIARVSELLTSPGTTITMLDGNYSFSTTGLPRFTCGNTALCQGPEPCGTQSQPIILKAKNQRKARVIASDGFHGDLLSLTRCRDWVVDGIRVDNTDQSVANSNGQSQNFKFRDVDRVAIINNLAFNNNAHGNNHLYAVEYSTNITFTDNEGYKFHRHCMSFFQNVGGVIERNYCNGRAKADVSGCSGTGSDVGPYCSNTPSGPDEGISLYGSSNFKVTNNVLQNGGGIASHGIGTVLEDGVPFAALEYGGSENFIAGNLILGGPPYGAYFQARDGAPHSPRNNTLRNNLIYGASGYGLFLRGPSNLAIDALAIWKGSLHGFQAQDSGYVDCNCLNSSDAGCTGNNAPCPCCTGSGAGSCSESQNPCGFTPRNIVASENTTAGFNLADITEDYLCPTPASLFSLSNGSVSNAFFNSTCTTPASSGTITGYGDDNAQTLAFVPNTATALNDDGNATPPSKVCKGTTTSEYRPCTTAADCTGGAPTCVNPVGPTLLTQYRKGERTWNAGCTAAGLPWSCCGAAAPSALNRCELWATQSDDCGGVACTTQATDCLGTHVAGTLNKPTCLNHWMGAGAIVAGVNDTNNDSAFDVHEHRAVHFGQRAGVDVTVPTFP